MLPGIYEQIIGKLVNTLAEQHTGKIRKKQADVQQGVIKSRDADGIDRFYHMSRIGMALAKADGMSTNPVDMDSESWIGKYNTEHPYTEAEWKMFKAAHNTVPSDTQEAMPWTRSKEPDDTHRVSPVPNRSKLK